MRTILLLLLISASISAQENFDYLLYGESMANVTKIYSNYGHKLLGITTKDGIIETTYTSPREGFVCISYDFKNDSCFAIKFYFDKKWDKHIKKTLDKSFQKEKRNVWKYPQSTVIFCKFTNKISYLKYIQ